MPHKTLEALEELITATKQNIPLGSSWKHYKGNTYIILDIVFATEDEHISIVYINQDHPNIHFSRPLASFLSAQNDGQTKFTRIA